MEFCEVHKSPNPLMYLLRGGPKFLVSGACDSSTVSAASLERFLLFNYEEIAQILFNYWDVKSIIMFGRTNIRMYGLVHLYTARTWGIKSVLRSYFKDVNAFMSVLESEQAVIFGEFVRRFFNRTSWDTFDTLDVCVQKSAALRMRDLLEGESYHFQRASQALDFNTAAAGAGKMIAPPTQHCINFGDGVFPTHGVVSLQFERNNRRRSYMRKSKITLHLVRCTPIQHILASQTSESIGV